VSVPCLSPLDCQPGRFACFGFARSGCLFGDYGWGMVNGMLTQVAEWDRRGSAATLSPNELIQLCFGREAG